MECLMIDVLLSLGHFMRRCKHTHILGLKLPVVSWDPSQQSLVGHLSIRYLVDLSLLVGSLQTNWLEQTYIVLSHFHSNPDYWVSVLMELCWQQ